MTAAQLAAGMAALVVGLSPCPAWAGQNVSLSPSDPHRRLAEACSADGAFGYRFRERRPGGREGRPLAVAPTADWPMLSRVLLGRTPRSATVVAITGVVEVRPEEDQTAADAVQALLDAVADEVDLSGQYLTRDDSFGTVFRTYDLDAVASEDPLTDDVRFELYEEEGEAWLMCLDSDGEGLVWTEVSGQGQTEPPVRPDLALPPRPAETVCDHPTSARQLTASLEGLQDEIFASGQRGNQYFADLNGWYGQQLKAIGSWDDDRGFEFAVEMMRDPVISNGLTEQLGRLGESLGHLSASARAEEAGDVPGACTAAVKGLHLAHDIVEANRVQWDHIRRMYHAEAGRLGVTLTD